MKSIVHIFDGAIKTIATAANEPVLCLAWPTYKPAASNAKQLQGRE